ncbi:reverse transcriptase family protein [Aeromonas caviae]|uniref:reverse transcriptase family protein n=1 Tax=Aeromonas caviae TaxID=648 RepID=UPI002AB4F3B9|nr:reverse transcriptase family protein [Aeromonas caviae]MDY7831348.1 reverse transcriptase family protein [Aeromonas caviae]
MDKPYYPFKPIASIDALAKTLGVHPKILVKTANDAQSAYTSFQIETKNKIRVVHEPKYTLKLIQKRINSRIFEKVIYPEYLMGGIKSLEKRDYVENAARHTQSKTLINLDIKSFYENIKENYVFDIYKKLFHFPDDVSSIMTQLTTLRGRVPQGACTSSYVANLIFFNSEYSLVSEFRARGLVYTRLLDDVAISTNAKNLDNDEIEKIIKSVAALFRKFELKIKNKKTKIEYKNDINSEYKVTGLWVGNNHPRLRKMERRYIRQLVYVCEQKHAESSSSSDYHDFWNKCSGLVAKMTRLNHAEAPKLRDRLSKILPIYDEITKKKIYLDIYKLFRRASVGMVYTHGLVTKINVCYYQLGILGRTDKGIAKSIRRKMKVTFKNLPTKSMLWE